MITNTQELTVALRSLDILDKSLDALRGQLMTANPDLLAATAAAYVWRIASLQAEIAAYLDVQPLATRRGSI